MLEWWKCWLEGRDERTGDEVLAASLEVAARDFGQDFLERHPEGSEAHVLGKDGEGRVRRFVVTRKVWFDVREDRGWHDARS